MEIAYYNRLMFYLWVHTMTTSSLPAINSVLSQMRNVAQSAANQPSTATLSANATPSFVNELQNSLNRLAAVQNSANAQAEQFVAGTSKASLNDVMIDLQKASVAFQSSVQVRNRLVQAYQTIASMPV